MLLRGSLLVQFNQCNYGFNLQVSIPIIFLNSSTSMTVAVPDVSVFARPNERLTANVVGKLTLLFSIRLVRRYCFSFFVRY
jgi:hypothetical protein